MTNNLNDTQLVVLTRAAAREDRLLERPLTHAGAAAMAFAKKLIRLGLAEPVMVSPAQPHWQRSDAGEPIGLAITPEGLAALNLGRREEEPGEGVESGTAPETGPAEVMAEVEPAAMVPESEPQAEAEAGAENTLADPASDTTSALEAGAEPLRDGEAVADEASGDASAEPAEPRHRAPRRREGTKRAGLLAMLRSRDGASLDAIVTATGWLPHTARAAITGLRQDGHPVERFKDDQGTTRYRIAEAVERPTEEGLGTGEELSDGTDSDDAATATVETSASTEA